MKFFIFIILILVFFGCAQTERANPVYLSNDYQLLVKGPNGEPYWLDDLEGWGKVKFLEDNGRLYFSIKGKLSANRDIACKNISDNAPFEVSDVLISDKRTFTKTKSDTEIVLLRDALENSLLVEAGLLRKIDEYYEDRQYLKSLGAETDYYASICAQLYEVDLFKLSKTLGKSVFSGPDRLEEQFFSVTLK